MFLQKLIYDTMQSGLLGLSDHKNIKKIFFFENYFLKCERPKK